MSDTQRRRHTRYRQQVRELLSGSEEFLSAQTVHTMLRSQGLPIGLTTVYRNLQALTKDGTVDVRRASTGEQIFRHCSPVQHHHLMCRHCSRAVEVTGPALDQWATALAEVHGFTDINHSVEIFGTCGSCADTDHQI